MNIAVLVPCYNEGLTIQKVVSDFKEQLPDAKIYVYDNNSTDNTIAEAEAAGAIVRKERQQGKANVVRRMFREIEADYYVMVDGDDTYPASEVKKILEPVIEGECYMATGDRITNGTYAKENSRAFHQLGNKTVRTLINRFFKADLCDIMTGYRAFNRKFVKTYPVLCSGFELETEMTIFALNNNLPLCEIHIDFQERPEGSFSKLNTFTDGFKVLWTVFNFFRHYKPFMFFLGVAGFFVLLSLATGIPVLYEYFEYRYIYKVPSAILASGLMMLAFLAFTIGMILDTIAIINRKNFQVFMNND